MITHYDGYTRPKSRTHGIPGVEAGLLYPKECFYVPRIVPVQLGELGRRQPSPQSTLGGNSVGGRV